MIAPIREKGWYYNHVNASAENSFLYLHSREVRDLAWSCFAAPLLVSSQLSSSDSLHNATFALNSERMDWLRSLDREPQPLLDHLAKTSTTRLGLYFERLWHFFLIHDPEVTLIAHNLPVRSASRTLGEFDCIYFCHQRQRSVHLELAVKFYLSAPQARSSDQRLWLGPASVDRLDLKLQRMLSHQIRLADTPEGSATLAKLGVSEPLHEIEVKGRLFTYWQQSAPPPPAYNQALTLSHWCRVSELANLEEEAATLFLPLERSQWLSPVHDPDTTATNSSQLARQIAAALATDSRPLQVAVIDCEKRERRRFFVVADHWPINNR